ncbi:MAG: flavin reductase family protein [Bacteroidales bacterium]|nr:flavin reductase family protein [Bacteroidales bacterium]
MLKIDPKNTPVPKVHRAMLGAVAPRPIAFASTIDPDGNPNLSPFSFFNAFGANPPTLIFSPSRRGRDNTTKHTYENLKEVPEVVINVVNFKIVEQMNLASTDFPRGINEFAKSGLTPVKSELIKPFRVKESPVQFECKVNQIIEMGDQGGAGNLIICEILLIHIDESVLDEKGIIVPQKIDLVGRMGGDYYCRASGESIFEVKKPHATVGIGIDQLPDKIKFSKYLTGNELGKLGNIEALPTGDEVKKFIGQPNYAGGYNMNNNEKEKMVFVQAKRLIAENNIQDAVKLLMGLL